MMIPIPIWLFWLAVAIAPFAIAWLVSRSDAAHGGGLFDFSGLFIMGAFFVSAAVCWTALLVWLFTRFGPDVFVMP